MAEESGYANDDNRRAERGLMGSLGTPGDQPRKLLENAREMCLTLERGQHHFNPEIPWKTRRPRQTMKMGFIIVLSWEHMETSPETFGKNPQGKTLKSTRIF